MHELYKTIPLDIGETYTFLLPSFGLSMLLQINKKKPKHSRIDISKIGIR